MRKRKYFFSGVAVLILPIFIIGFHATLFAHSGAKGVVKERMDTMKSIGSQMKKLGAMAKNPTLFDSAVLRESAIKLHEHAQKIPDLFPKGSNQKPSEARNEIWSDWNNFIAINKDLIMSAEELQTVSTENFKSVFLKAAQTCKGCHQDYRLKK